MKQEKNNKQAFTIFPNIIFDLGLSNAELLLLITFYSFANKDGYCYPSYTALCKRSGLSRPWVSQTIKSLIEKGLMKKETEYNSKYWLTQLTSKVSELVNSINQLGKLTLPNLVNSVNSNNTKEQYKEQLRVYPPKGNPPLSTDIQETSGLVDPSVVSFRSGIVIPSLQESNIKTKSIRQSTKQNRYPTLSEVVEYVEKKGLKINPKDFLKYYEDRDWIDNNNNKVKNWKNKAITWSNKNKEKEEVTIGKIY